MEEKVESKHILRSRYEMNQGLQQDRLKNFERIEKRRNRNERFVV